MSALSVKLIHAFGQPLNTAVAAARTCYSPTLVHPDQVGLTDVDRGRRDALAQSIYDAGHHTTLQHPHFQFAIEGVSRLCIWSFLHSHPFYNSEQVSQRYVAVNPDHIYEPNLSPGGQDIFRHSVKLQQEAYRRLTELLLPVVVKEYRKLFPLRDPQVKPWDRAVRRRAQEVARYVLPLATTAHLHHTISGLTLHRYHRLMAGFDVPEEQRQLVEALRQCVAGVDAPFADRMEDPIPLEETPEYLWWTEFAGATASPDFLNEFDRSLDGKSSKLVGHTVHPQETLAQALRTVLGVSQSAMSDALALERLFNPAHNRYLTETLNLNAHSKVMRALSHVHLTFRKKISHAADSQDQRHRLTPGSRPILAAHVLPDKPDYVLPPLVSRAPEAEALYHETMADTWQAFARLRQEEGAERALYLLPNALNVRFEESGDLLNFHHKWTKRLCYTAQEEIWTTCREEVEQLGFLAPLLAKHLGAPCALRASARVRPFCPEGDRFCGVLVWRLPLNQYRRVL